MLEIKNLRKNFGNSTEALKGVDLEINGIKIRLIPLFHPAAIIYNRSLINHWEKDMEIVKNEIFQ